MGLYEEVAKGVLAERRRHPCGVRVGGLRVHYRWEHRPLWALFFYQSPFAISTCSGLYRDELLTESHHVAQATG